MAVLHHGGLHPVQGPGQLGRQEVFAVELLGGELEGGTGAVVASQQQEVPPSPPRGPGHQANLPLGLLPPVDSQPLPVQNIQGRGRGVSEYGVEPSTDTRVRPSSNYDQLTN